MTHERTNQLTDVTMLYTPVEFMPPLFGGVRESLAVRQSMVESAAFAEALGARVVINSSGCEAIPEDGFVLNPRPDPTMTRLRDVENRTRQERPSIFVPSVPLAAYDPAELLDTVSPETPLVAAYRPHHRGHGKYLLETPQQIWKMLDFNRENPQHKLGEDMEIRPFVTTPSEHYTSYRVLATATGSIIAAALLVSAHIKNEPRLLNNNRTDDTNPHFADIKRAFEDPDSSYYIGSKNVCSNVSGGARSIPLLGVMRQFDAQTANILEKHGHDPAAPALSPAMAERAAWIARATGSELDIILGIDFLNDDALEINPGPGSGTFSQCWLDGQIGQQSQTLLRRTALLSMAHPDVPVGAHLSVNR